MSLRHLLPLLCVGLPLLAQPAPPAHENLNALVWMQHSVEFQALTTQAYRSAQRMLDEALRDPAWTASVEQQAMGPARYRDLPPAVILDLDETMLDNTAYNARMIDDPEGRSYDPASWSAWAREQKASALPGAVEFARHAVLRGAHVYYVTNRSAQAEGEATLANLRKLGLPVDPALATLLARTDVSDKGPRRLRAAERHRVLLLLGDDFNDFLSGTTQDMSQRRQLFSLYSVWWGTKWFMLPNPVYGSWEGLLVPATARGAERNQRKRALLRREQ